jgi:hypothetical protein
MLASRCSRYWLNVTKKSRRDIARRFGEGELQRIDKRSVSPKFARTIRRSRFLIVDLLKIY